MMLKLERVLKYTYQHIIRNGWLSFASIAIMTLTFFVISIFSLTVYSVNVVLHYYESKSQIILFFNPNAPASYISAVKKDIENTHRATEIKYVSKKQAFVNFEKTLKTQNPQLAKAVDLNALPPSYEISTNNLSNLEYIAGILYKLKSQSKGEINNILYFKSVVQFLKKAVSIITSIGIGLIVFLSIISFVIIIITVAITINSHSEEIEIMKLVGATDTYVSGPFIFEGAFYGIIGVFASSIILYLIFLVLNTYYRESVILPLLSFFQGIPIPQYSPLLILEIIFVEVLLGIIIGSISSFIAISRYLKK
jgi:cell division transport system permease protein